MADVGPVTIPHTSSSPGFVGSMGHSHSMQLHRIQCCIGEVRSRFTALDGRVSEANWARRPDAASWSVAECIAHLNLTSAAMTSAIRAALDEAKRLPPMSRARYRGTLVGRMLAATMGPVKQIAGFKLGKVRTPPPFVPGAELAREDVRRKFLAWLEEEEALVSAARGLAIDAVRVESPFKAGVFYDAYSALRIVVLHEKRHLVQAERAHAALRA